MFSDDLQRFLSDFGREELADDFIEHFKFGTADVYYEGGRLVGAVRWNVSLSGKTAYILDLFISPGADGKTIMRYFGFRLKNKFPSVSYIKYDRPHKKVKRYNIVHKLSSLF